MVNKIRSIEIKKLGQHENTKFDLGLNLTIIAAANGTGKSTFSNVLDGNLTNYINIDYMNPINSEIIFKGNYGSKNYWVFNVADEKFYERSEKNKLRLNFNVYNDQEFYRLSSTHNTKNYLMSLNKQKLKKLNAYQDYEIINFIKDAFYKMKKFEMFEVEKFSNFIHELISSVYTKEAFSARVLGWKNSAMSFFEKPRHILPKKNFNNEKRFFSHDFIKFEKAKNIYYRIKSNNFEFKDLFNYILDFHGSIETSLPSTSEQDLGDSFEELTIIYVWLRFFNFLEKRWWKNMRRFWHNNLRNIFHLADDEKSIIRIFEDNLSEATFAYNKAKNKNEKHSDAINEAIKMSSLHTKIKITKDLTIISRRENREVILSTGELKILNLILFLEEKVSLDGLIVLDDPLASIDAEYVDFFSKYLRDYISKNNKQVILLTHSNHVFYSMINIFRKKIEKDKKLKINSKKVKMHKWMLDENYVVKSEEVVEYQPHICLLVKKIMDKSNDNIDRIFYFRRFLENVYFSVYGNSEFSVFFKEKHGESGCVFLEFLGTYHKFSWDILKIINNTSHWNYIDVEEEINIDSRRKNALKEIESFIEKINIRDTKISDNRPFKTIE